MINLLIAVFALPGFTYGQEKKVIRKRIEIGQNANENQRSSNSGDYYGKYAVTIEPTKLISGEFPVTLQYALTDWLVLEGGAGLTWRNYFMDLLEEFSFDQPVDVESTTDVNPSFLIGAKFFPELDVFNDEYYLGIQYAYRKYSSSFDFEDAQYVGGKTYQDISLLYGAHYSTGVDWIYFDSYVGVGIRLVDEYGLSEQFNPNTLGYAYQPYEESRSTLGFVMGIKAGFILN